MFNTFGQKYADNYMEALKKDPTGANIWVQYDIWRKEQENDPENWKAPENEDYIEKPPDKWTTNDFENLGKNTSSWILNQIKAGKMDRMTAIDQIGVLMLKWDQQAIYKMWFHPISVADAKYLFLKQFPPDIQMGVKAAFAQLELENKQKQEVQDLALKKKKRKWWIDQIWKLIMG